jgi:BioD-like phosphotransacetylase family protein
MIDQISKLKDHVNVSIMKAVQVDESRDTMCSLDESLYTDTGPKIIFAHAEALLEDKKYTDNLKAIVVDEAHLVNTQW